MVILGLDPGSRFTGFGVVHRAGNSLTRIDAGRLSVPTKIGTAQRLAWLGREVGELLLRFEPDAVAIETTFAGVNNRSLIVMAQARGAILSALGATELEPREFSPAEIKRTVAGNGRAGKDQVARMVGMLLGIDAARLSADATDALAVAVCCAQNVTMDEIRRRVRR